MIIDSDVQDREQTARSEFLRDVWGLAGHLEQMVSSAREVLPQLADDDSAAVRDFLLRACKAAGQVAADAEQEA